MPPSLLDVSPLRNPPESPEPAAPIDPRKEAVARAEKCGRAIEAVLREHRCRIVPYLLPPEPVGQEGTKALLQASFGVVPEP